jgi:hypothetical protein
MGLPLIDATGLSAERRAGTACVVCGKGWPKPEVPVARTGAGEILYRCGECVLTAEPAD